MASPEGGIADDVVPMVDWDPAGEQRAAAGVGVVEDTSRRSWRRWREREARPESSRMRSQVLASRWMRQSGTRC